MTPVALRNQAIRVARAFFAAENILEVMTPKAVASPALEPYIDALSVTAAESTEKLFLATSPEFALKKIFASERAAHPTAGGIYEIAPVFRDDRPGKNHGIEFTMIEWYQKDTTLNEILQSAESLISKIAQDTGTRLPSGRCEVIELQQLFAEAGHAFAFSKETGVLEKYHSLHGSLPGHLNDTDAAIVCFNLLFDELVLPLLRRKNALVAVAGYPEYLGALAYVENGVAERAEIFFRGIELANGYREEFRPGIAADRWRRYNRIRALRGVSPHVIDTELLAALPGLEGVSGIALGLERLLVCLHPGPDVRAFLQAPSSSFLP